MKFDVEVLKERMDIHVSKIASYNEAYEEVVKEIAALCGNEPREGDETLSFTYQGLMIKAEIPHNKIIKNLGDKTEKQLIKEEIYNEICKALLV